MSVGKGPVPVKLEMASAIQSRYPAQNRLTGDPCMLHNTFASRLVVLPMLTNPRL